MANEEHLAKLLEGDEEWIEWRRQRPATFPELAKANLYGADLRATDLRAANLCEADLRAANLEGANLEGADLEGADLCGAKLFRADLGRADLRAANLEGANLEGADLCGADLCGAKPFRANLRGANLEGADLRLASLIDAHLDCAGLTDAKLWETQRGGWSISGITCRRAFWDREGKEPTEYAEREFERVFAEKPRIVLRYPGGMSPIDLAMLPLIVERLQAEHPDCVLHIRSVQDDGSGASVTITVEDRASRNDNAFKREFAQLQTELKCIVDERDYLRQHLGSVFSEALSKVAEVMALPRQTLHLYNPTGLPKIEGPTMSRDTYNTSGQTGAVGPRAHAHDMTFQQVRSQSGLDLPKLADELAQLRGALRQQSRGEAERDEALGAVAAAEKAAKAGDGPAALRHLKGAGKWALGVAEKIGTAVAVEAIKRAT